MPARFSGPHLLVLAAVCWLISAGGLFAEDGQEDLLENPTTFRATGDGLVAESQALLFRVTGDRLVATHIRSEFSAIGPMLTATGKQEAFQATGPALIALKPVQDFKATGPELSAVKRSFDFKATGEPLTTVALPETFRATGPAMTAVSASSTIQATGAEKGSNEGKGSPPPPRSRDDTSDFKMARCRPFENHVLELNRRSLNGEDITQQEDAVQRAIILAMPVMLQGDLRVWCQTLMGHLSP